MRMCSSTEGRKTSLNMMMLPVAFIIMTVPVLSGKAQETGISCPSSTPDGWNFPQVGLQDDIKWRSHVPQGTQEEECLRTITIDKNEASHLLTQTIKLRNKASQEELLIKGNCWVPGVDDPSYVKEIVGLSFHKYNVSSEFGDIKGCKKFGNEAGKIKKKPFCIVFGTPKARNKTCGTSKHMLRIFYAFRCGTNDDTRKRRHRITLNQTYLFYQDDQGKYNIFNTTPSTPPPHGSYQFVYSDPQCAVVEYKSFTFNSEGAGERADSTSEHATKPYCTLWVRHNTVTENHTCCERFFNTTCDTSNLHVMYEATTCASSAN